MTGGSSVCTWRGGKAREKRFCLYLDRDGDEFEGDVAGSTNFALTCNFGLSGDSAANTSQKNW